MSNLDLLGDRMKGYENISRIYLTHKCPVIIRIDGKAFHSFTRGFKKPFDDVLIQSMQETAKYLCENIMGCKLAYIQSDEISLLLVDYEKNETQAWFDNNLQKIVSIAASMATMKFNKCFEDISKAYIDSVIYLQDNDIKESYLEALCKAREKGAMFDARAFILPKDEVCNYFIWRQQDATRNSIQMVAQANFSHKELQGKSCDALQDMLYEKKGTNWNDCDAVYKRGSCVTKKYFSIVDLGEHTGSLANVTRSRWVVDKDIPTFLQDREYINQYVYIGEAYDK